MSHSPLMGRNDPAQNVIDDVDAAFESARAFITDFAPDVVMIFAPDHYNGVYYDLMPPFCIGAAAQSVGDYGTEAGPLTVDREAAYAVAREVLGSGIDTAFSERMYVDHGFAQALQLLVGSISAVPTVPIFINSVAEPLGPVSRVRLLGEAVGRAAVNLDKRVLFVGSGGLSHDPPVPQFATAPVEVKEKLIDGRNPTEAERNAREQRVVDAGRDFAAGVATIQPLNPQWDRHLLDVLASGDLALDRFLVQRMVRRTSRTLLPRSSHLDRCVRISERCRPIPRHLDFLPRDSRVDRWIWDYDCCLDRRRLELAHGGANTDHSRVFQ